MTISALDVSRSRFDRDPRWAAVLARDARADGAFVYSVRTTGVYCRPSCGARRPNVENVDFHTSGVEAERLGFRACRRCTPDVDSLAQRRASLIAEACRLIETSDAPPTLTALAHRAGLSPHHFHRVFRSLTGLTPHEYASAHRARQVQTELRRNNRVIDAIYESGWGSTGRFYAVSQETLGMTPSQYRANGAGTTIRFAVGECSLGFVLVALNDRGVCAILLGDEPGRLQSELEGRFSNANLVGGDDDLEQTLAQVLAFVEEPSRGLDLPLDVRGTAFQHRVWDALRRVPSGSTVTYSDLAMRIGSPRAARAVARACAANALAVAIPCHRVVKSDGAPGGYRWGVERKHALLNLEESARSRRPERETRIVLGSEA